MRRVLVLGGGGYIARKTISVLSEEKSLIIDATYRNNQPNLEVGNSVNFIDVNHFHAEQYQYDVVLNLAGYLSPYRDKETAKNLICGNIAFPSVLLSRLKIKESGIFIDVGSSAELHNSDNRGVNYLYSETKKAFSGIAKYFSKINGYSYCKVYLYSVVSEERENKKVIDALVESIGSEFPVPMTDGSQVLDFIHRDDVSEVFKRIILIKNFSKLDGIEMECCTGVGTSIRDLATMIEKKSGKKLNIKWGKLSYREADIMSAIGNPKTLKQNLNWSPRIDINDTISRILNNYEG